MYYAQMQLYWYCTRGEKQRTLSIQLSLHGMDTQDTLLNTQVSGPEESQVHCQ